MAAGKKDCPPVAELAESMKVWLRAYRAEQNRIEWFAPAVGLIGLVHMFVHWSVGAIAALIYMQASTMYFSGALAGGAGREPGFKLHVNLLKTMLAIVVAAMLHVVAMEAFGFDALAAVGVRSYMNEYGAAVAQLVQGLIGSVLTAVTAGDGGISEAKQEL